MDPGVQPFVAYLLGPLFILMGVYMIVAGPLPGQSRSLHWQLGGGAILVGLVALAAGLMMPPTLA